MSTFADFTFVPPSGTDTLVGYRTTAAGGEIRTTVSQLFANPTISGYTQTASAIIPATAMSGTVVDIGKPVNVASVTGDVSLTFSNGTPVAGTRTLLKITADGTARTITIPESWSINRNSTITSVVVPANGTLALLLEYTGARWEVYGDPVATTGTGDFVLASASRQSLGGALADAGWLGVTEDGTAGAALAFGDLVYYNSASKWVLTDADAEATAGPVKIGFVVLAASGDNQPTRVLRRGKIRADSKFPTLTVGAPVYVGVTAGEVQVAAVTGEDDVIRIVGHANTADEIDVNPSNEYTVVKA